MKKAPEARVPKTIFKKALLFGFDIVLVLLYHLLRRVTRTTAVMLG